MTLHNTKNSLSKTNSNFRTGFTLLATKLLILWFFLRIIKKIPTTWHRFSKSNQGLLRTGVWFHTKKGNFDMDSSICHSTRSRKFSEPRSIWSRTIYDRPSKSTEFCYFPSVRRRPTQLYRYEIWNDASKNWFDYAVTKIQIYFIFENVCAIET